MRQLAELMYYAYLKNRKKDFDNQAEEYYKKEKLFRKSLNLAQKEFFAEYERRTWDIQEEREIKIFEYIISLFFIEEIKNFLLHLHKTKSSIISLSPVLSYHQPHNRY